MQWSCNSESNIGSLTDCVMKTPIIVDYQNDHATVDVLTLIRQDSNGTHQISHEPL